MFQFNRLGNIHLTKSIRLNESGPITFTFISINIHIWVLLWINDNPICDHPEHIRIHFFNRTWKYQVGILQKVQLSITAAYQWLINQNNFIWYVVVIWFLICLSTASQRVHRPKFNPAKKQTFLGISIFNRKVEAKIFRNSVGSRMKFKHWLKQTFSSIRWTQPKKHVQWIRFHSFEKVWVKFVWQQQRILVYVREKK